MLPFHEKESSAIYAEIFYGSDQILLIIHNMAPIICFATGASGAVLPGIRVLLYCCDQKGNPTLQFSAYTDEFGTASVWYATTWPVHPYQEPTVVDALEYPRVRVIFVTGDYFRAALYPWLDLSTDLFLQGQLQHIITLEVSEGNSRLAIKYDCRPLQQWLHLNMFPSMPIASTVQGTDQSSMKSWSIAGETCSPSPSSFYSLGSDKSDDRASLDAVSPLASNSEALGPIERKRKADLDDLPPAKRRCGGIGRRASIAEFVNIPDQL